MKIGRCLAAGAALATMMACSSGPAGPTSGSSSPGVVPGGTEGRVSAAAVSAERVRLRRVGGGDIRSELATGQVIDVPVNVKLDVWAEIVRLEADRARLLVDWGNGNVEFTGCGSCRLENTYTQPGRYPLKVTILDLNAPGGPAPVTFISVTLNVDDFEALACFVTMDFEGFPTNPTFPLTRPGVTVSSTGRIGADPGAASAYVFPPEINGNYLLPAGGSAVVDFETDKVGFSAGVGLLFSNGAVIPMNYLALSATGDVVASGSFAPGTYYSPAFRKGILSFRSDRPFRRVSLSTTAPQNAFALDDLTGRCR